MVTAQNRRRDKDVMKLLVSSYKVELPDETKMNEIIVNFPGPTESPYANVSINLCIHLLHSHPFFLLDVGSLESSSSAA